MVIKILGVGCAKCKQLKLMAREVVAELALPAEVVEVTDIPTIMSYGIIGSPGLVIDEKVVGYGSVPSRTQLTSLFRQAAAKAK